MEDEMGRNSELARENEIADDEAAGVTPEDVMADDPT